jgi:diacylglycerol kinase family enzyme/membrane-associated phospholipid phosphatase
VRRQSVPRRTGVCALGLAGAFAALTVLVLAQFGPMFSGDHQVAVWAHDTFSGHRALQTLRLVAVVFQPWHGYVVLTLLAVVLAIRGARRTASWILISTVIVLVANIAIKYAIDRPRPSEALVLVGGGSFPSGHSDGIALFTTVLVLLTIVSLAPSPLRTALIAGWVALGLLVGLDRIFLAVHNVSDVVGGWLLGAFVVLGVHALLRVNGADLHRPRTVTPTLATPARHHLGVVLNPTSVTDGVAFRRKVTEAAQRHGWDATSWFETTSDDAGRSMTHAALAEGADTMLVAGGDGTVRVVCGELARTGIPIGIVPTGTGNLLARNLGLPLNIDAALEVIFTGDDRAVDIARIDGDGLGEKTFVVMAGLGLDAAIMESARTDLKDKMGWSAYVVAALKQIRYPSLRVEISIDSGPFEKYRARTVVIGNVGYLQAGIPLLPDAVIDDGLLDVVVIAPRRSLGWLSLVVRVMLRRPKTDDRLARMTGRRVVVRAANPTPRQLDGDSVGPGHELRAEVQAGVLLVRVPR